MDSRFLHIAVLAVIVVVFFFNASFSVKYVRVQFKRRWLTASLTFDLLVEAASRDGERHRQTVNLYNFRESGLDSSPRRSGERRHEDSLATGCQFIHPAAKLTELHSGVNQAAIQPGNPKVVCSALGWFSATRVEKLVSRGLPAVCFVFVYKKKH